MLKDYLKQKNISIYSLSKKLGLAYSTLNDLANGKVDLKNCRVGFAMALKDELGLSFEQLIEISSNKYSVDVESLQDTADVQVENKKYVATFKYGEDTVRIPIDDVRESTTYFIEDLTNWRISEYIRNEKFGAAEDEWNTN